MTVSIVRKAKASFHLADRSSSKKQPEGKGKRTGHREFYLNGIRALYRKEMADHIHSRRFAIVLGLILITSFAGIYGALSNLSNTEISSSDYLFLKIFTLSGNATPSFMSFIALLGPFVGISLGFDAVNSERSEGTLKRLVSQPIYRDCVINGKFLAGAGMIFLMVCSMGLFAGAAGILVSGILPSVQEVGRIIVFLFFTGVYICFWLALSILCSVVCRHAATSAMTVIALWIFFSLFMTLVSGILANAVFPAGQEASVRQILNNYSLQLGLNRLSPYYLYSEAVSTIMDPTVRTTSLILPEQLSGAITGYLSLGQSCLLVWPHLTGLLAGTSVVFAVSYIRFMRMEIRN